MISDCDSLTSKLKEGHRNLARSEAGIAVASGALLTDEIAPYEKVCPELVAGCEPFSWLHIAATFALVFIRCTGSQVSPWLDNTKSTLQAELKPMLVTTVLA